MANIIQLTNLTKAQVTSWSASRRKALRTKSVNNPNDSSSSGDEQGRVNADVFKRRPLKGPVSIPPDPKKLVEPLPTKEQERYESLFLEYRNWTKGARKSVRESGLDATLAQEYMSQRRHVLRYDEDIKMRAGVEYDRTVLVRTEASYVITVPEGKPALFVNMALVLCHLK